MTTKYSFETTAKYDYRGDKHSRRGRRGNNSLGNNSSSSLYTDHHDADGDPSDGNASLTYSAASSVNSATNESTDSSFADIMRVLDGQDSKEVAAYLKKEAHRTGRDEKSVAESLAYSTDAESHLRSLATDGESALHGTDLLSTITGQASNSGAFSWLSRGSTKNDTDNNTPAEREEPDSAFGDPNLDIMFAPAEYTESIKRRKDRKRRERKERQRALLKDKASNNTSESGSKATSSGSVLPNPRVIESRQGTPPPPPKGQASSQSASARPPKSNGNNATSTGNSRNPRSRQSRLDEGGVENLVFEGHTTEGEGEDDDVWYAKWWMFCFPDTIRNMTMMMKR